MPKRYVSGRGFVTVAYLIGQVISEIRHSSTLVAKLEPELQRAARDSYAIALRAVFIMAACSTLLAYCVRLPVRVSMNLRLSTANEDENRIDT